MEAANVAQFLEFYERLTRGRIFLTNDTTSLKFCDRLFDAVRSKRSSCQIHQLALEAREYLWEVLHSKCWMEIDSAYLDAFGLVMLIAAATCTSGDQTRHDTETDSSERNQIALADAGLLLGSELYRDKLQQLIILINENSTKKWAREGSMENHSRSSVLLKDKLLPLKLKYSESSGDRLSSIALKDHQDCDILNILPTFLTATIEKSRRCSLVPVLNTPDLVHFYQKCLLLSRPAVLTGCMEEWPAIAKWRNLDYYRKGTIDRLFCTMLRIWLPSVSPNVHDNHATQYSLILFLIAHEISAPSLTFSISCRQQISSY